MDNLSRQSPRTSSELVGHMAALSAIRADFEQRRLAHGILLSGPKGIGKATLAFHIARMLLSEGRPDDEAIARRIAAGSHADLLVVEPLFDAKKGEVAREITVEQAREIGQFLSLTPGESDWRVVIIDSADALNINAANAILKILEEPPPQAVLLLVSHNPGKLLPTIRSRCRLLKLHPLDSAGFSQTMRLLLPEVPAGRLEALGQMAQLSPGLAQELEEQGAVTLYTELLELLAGLPHIDPLALHAFAERMGGGAVHRNWQLVNRLLLCAIERAGKTACGLLLDPICEEEPAALQALAALHGAGEWARRWQTVLDQFLLAESRHLDYKQLFIATVHALAAQEMLVLQ